MPNFRTTEAYILASAALLASVCLIAASFFGSNAIATVAATLTIIGGFALIFGLICLPFSKTRRVSKSLMLLAPLLALVLMAVGFPLGIVEDGQHPEEFIYVPDRSKAPPTSEAPQPQPNNNEARSRGEETIANDASIGCIDREYFEKLTRYVSEGDKEAYKSAFFAALLSDQCIPFKQGETVYLEDAPTFSGVVQIHRKGETVSYWTNVEALK